MRVLVAEDNELEADMLRHTLAQFGYERHSIVNPLIEEYALQIDVVQTALVKANNLGFSLLFLFCLSPRYRLHKHLVVNILFEQISQHIYRRVNRRIFKIFDFVEFASCGYNHSSKSGKCVSFTFDFTFSVLCKRTCLYNFCRVGSPS